MAGEAIDVPIHLPTDSTSVSAAKDVVGGLADAMRALGPAAAAGSSQAQRELKALQSAALAAQKEVTRAQAQQSVREGFGHVPARSAEEAKARARAEAEAGRAAVKAAEDEAKARQKHARDTAEIQRAFMKGAADKRAADVKELEGFASGALAVVTSLIAAVGALSAKFLSALTSVQAFREATMGAFSKLLGGAGAANKAFKDSIATADEVGAGYREVLSSVNALLAQGFKADQAQEVVKAMADLKSVNPAANLESIVNALGKIKATGHLQGDELNMLNEAGLSAQLVYEALAKQMGKTVDEIQKMQKAGKLGADDVIKAVLAGIQATTKMPIGKAAAEASKSLGGLIARLTQVPEGLLLMADASKGMGKLKDVLSNVLAAFAPSTEGGKALAASIGKLGDAFATFVDGLTGKDGAALLKDFALSLSKSVDAAAQLVQNIGALAGPMIKGFIEGFNAANKALGTGEEVKGAADGYAELGKALGLVGKGLGALVALAGNVGVIFGAAGQIFEMVGSLGELGGKLSGLWASIQGSISSAAGTVYTAAQSIGTNLVNGIIAGIGMASPLLAVAVQGLAGMTTGTMKGAVQTHSPSVLWRDEIGYQLPAGAAEGIYKGAPMMARAAQDVASSTTTAGAAGVGSASVAGGPSAGPITFHIYGGEGRSVKDQVIEALHTVFGSELSYA